LLLFGCFRGSGVRGDVLGVVCCVRTERRGAAAEVRGVTAAAAAGAAAAAASATTPTPTQLLTKHTRTPPPPAAPQHHPPAPELGGKDAKPPKVGADIGEQPAAAGVAARRGEHRVEDL
jgi:hypothetical protein